MPRLRLSVVLPAIAVTLAACGSTTSPAASASVKGTITVGAATSLTKSFTALAADFERRYPGVKVTLSFGSSKDVRTNINNGAPIDVFASSDWKNMKAVSEPLAAPAVEFATNSLAIVVQPGNPKHITTLADLAKAGVTVATGSPEVPIRIYTDTMLTNNGLLEKVSANYNNFAANVAGVVTYVVNGGSDAGVVYRTDVLAAGSSVLGVAIPAEQNVIAHYPIAELASSKNSALAVAFVAFVRSSDGQAILKQFGFGAG